MLDAGEIIASKLRAKLSVVASTSSLSQCIQVTLVS